MEINPYFAVAINAGITAFVVVIMQIVGKLIIEPKIIKAYHIGRKVLKNGNKHR